MQASASVSGMRATASSIRASSAYRQGEDGGLDRLLSESDDRTPQCVVPEKWSGHVRPWQIPDAVRRLVDTASCERQLDGYDERARHMGSQLEADYGELLTDDALDALGEAKDTRDSCRGRVFGHVAMRDLCDAIDGSFEVLAYPGHTADEVADVTERLRAATEHVRKSHEIWQRQVDRFAVELSGDDADMQDGAVYVDAGSEIGRRLRYADWCRVDGRLYGRDGGIVAFLASGDRAGRYVRSIAADGDLAVVLRDGDGTDVHVLRYGPVAGDG